MMRNAVAVFAILLIFSAVPQAASQYTEEYAGDDEYRSKKHAFDHPYPIVQESADYDKDYVKDENNDKGEWKAQMEYDRLRAKIVEAKKDLPPLEEEQAEAQKQYDEAVAEMNKVEEEVKDDEPIEEMEDDEEEVEEKEEEEKEEEEVKVPDLKLPPKPETEVSTKEVEAAIAHLKDCEKQMQDAKDKLMKVLDDRDLAKKDKEEADAAKAEAQDTYEKAKKATEEAEAQVKSAEETFEVAKTQYEKEVKDVEELEAALEKAAVKIRQIRGQVDDKGGIYQSGAQKPFGSLIYVGFASVLALMLCR